MSSSPTVWQPPPPRPGGPGGPSRSGPSAAARWAVRGGAVALTAMWGAVATVVAGLVVAPLVAPVVVALVGPPTSDPLAPPTAAQVVLTGLLVATPARLGAGVAGALLLQRCRGVAGRAQAVPVVAAGALGSWVLYAALLLPAAGSLEVLLHDERLLWELPRWVAEAAVGALLVPARSADVPQARGAHRSRVRWDDRGAATVEYAGVITVAVTLVLALVLAATGVGQRIAERICSALQLSCAAVEDRAVALGLSCTTALAERVNAAHAVVEFVRVSGQNSDGLTVDADGTATVRLAQGAGLGAEADLEHASAGGEEARPGVDAGVYAEAYGEAAYVYTFPPELGGETAARTFLESRRSTTGQVVDSVVPGAQAVREGVHDAQHAVGAAWDGFTGLLGAGPSAAERAATERRYRAGSADSVELVVGGRGEARASASAGVASGGLAASADAHGTVSVSLHDDGPDHAASTFAGAASGELAASLGTAEEVGGARVPVSAGVEGSVGGGAEYSVEYDDGGQPRLLSVTTTTSASASATAGLRTPGGGAGGGPGKGGTPASTGTGAADQEADLERTASLGGGTTVTTRTLDLSLPANRAAFDRVFATTGGEVDGHRFGVSAPRLDALAHVDELAAQLRRDAYTTQLRYRDADDVLDVDDWGAGLAAPGFGGGFDHSGSGQRLVSATAWDARSGGVHHPLVTCTHGA